ncbi:serpin B12-like [Pezoporus wallicus]|uniref:serpin B12-like n=1 Tax=Pezoporus wallicus TaxID=35540 RepID=UPI0025515EED|nr:serpin B12-like [Pezoporus wallicus]
MCSLGAANAKFCLYFFRELSKGKRSKNIFFSPLSLSAALVMVVLGGRGNTLEQIEKVLHFSEVLSSTSQGNTYPSEKVSNQTSSTNLKRGVPGRCVLMHLIQCLYHLGGVRLLIQGELQFTLRSSFAL